MSDADRMLIAWADDFGNATLNLILADALLDEGREAESVAHRMLATGDAGILDFRAFREDEPDNEDIPTPYDLFTRTLRRTNHDGHSYHVSEGSLRAWSHLPAYAAAVTPYLSFYWDMVVTLAEARARLVEECSLALSQPPRRTLEEATR